MRPPATFGQRDQDSEIVLHDRLPMDEHKTLDGDESRNRPEKIQRPCPSWAFSSANGGTLGRQRGLNGHGCRPRHDRPTGRSCHRRGSHGGAYPLKRESPADLPHAIRARVGVAVCRCAWASLTRCRMRRVRRPFDYQPPRQPHPLHNWLGEKAERSEEGGGYAFRHHSADFPRFPVIRRAAFPVPFPILLRRT